VIAIDWGTTNFRAFRLNHLGEVVDRRTSAGGILRIQDGRFEAALTSQVGDWLEDGEGRVLLCGMIGSRQGWVETRYLPCPVGLEELTSAVIEIPIAKAEVLLIPGISAADTNGVPELIRGEETEVIGVLDACRGEGLICVPGTHSKWIDVSEYKISSFLTCMTGEVFEALRTATILSRIMTVNSPLDEEAFQRGVDRSADGGGLLHHLFGVRALGLRDRLLPESSSSYLSGLLIGHEVRSLMAEGTHVYLAGSAQLCPLYAKAIRSCNRSFTLVNDNAAARGLASIGRRLRWL
jgi:2-dehydro-3-deoxygalactonokinase